MSDVSRLVGGMSYVEHTESVDQRTFPFVTLSRQPGAGADRLAETLLRVLEREADESVFGGWRIYDQELAEKITRGGRLHFPRHRLLTEEFHSRIEEFIAGVFGTLSEQDQVLKEMFNTIRTLAAMGKAIIVGRAGAQITAGLPLGVHVRLVAPEPIRVERMAKLFGKSEAEATRMTRGQEKARALLVKTYFHRDINDPLLYDVVWNTEDAPFETIADSIIVLIKRRIEALNQVNAASA